MVLRHELIPVPRNLSSDCGMCVKLQDDIEKTLPLLDKIDIAGCYDAEGKECKKFGVISSESGARKLKNS